jgi:DNA/RNA endonuclease G (NUC1)
MSKYLDNIVHYENIFGYNINNPSRSKQLLTPSKYNLQLLKKVEFDIFYSRYYKYPILVQETITKMTGKTDPNETYIDRRLIDDPFHEDLEIPEKYRYTLDDYKKYMEYGGSMGHNAPAGQHKTNMKIFTETFALSNITPQEMVFNSGLWALMENWSKFLARNNQLQNIMVFTGSIPSEVDTLFDGVKMNVPIEMFKIVVFEMPNYKPNTTFMEILIGKNKPFYVDPTINNFNLEYFLLSPQYYTKFQRETSIDLLSLLDYYGYNANKVRQFRKLVSMYIPLSPMLQMLMKKSNWFGYLIYAKSIEDLEAKWVQVQEMSNEFETLEYHQQFYEFTKQRLLDGRIPGRVSSRKKVISKKKVSSRGSKRMTTKNKYIKINISK